MRVFNRLVAILLLAGLIVAGVYAVVYAADLFGYRIADLPVSGVAGWLKNFVGDVESGSLSPPYVAVLVAVAVVGLVLLLAELKPRRPWRVRMDRGTYVTRGVVKDETEGAARMVPEVLDSSARAKARRRRGAKVKLLARVRRGDDEKALKRRVRDHVAEQLESGGVPVSRMKVRVSGVDPRQEKARVK